MILADLIKDVLFPRKCILCRRVLPVNETHICHECREDLPEYASGGRKIPFVEEHTALWFYRGNVRESLIRFKFHNKPAYADAYGPLLALRILRELPKPDLITWVPVSPGRKRRRGYDQAELLARSVGRELDIEVRPVLKKIRHNRAQSGIADASRRRANVLGVYRVTDEQAVKFKNVLLIDDILTSGATSGECARMILSAHADRVMLAVVAAGDKQKQKQGT